MALHTIDSPATRTGGRDGVGATAPAQAADAAYIASEMDWAIGATSCATACFAIAVDCALAAYKESNVIGLYFALVASAMTLASIFTVCRSRINVINKFRLQEPKSGGAAEDNGLSSAARIPH